MLNKKKKGSWISMGVWLTIVLLLLCITKDVHGFVNSPKVITKDGNLIFESGLNRNISFRLNGKSRININNELDLLDLLQFNKRGRNSTHLSVWDDGVDNMSMRELVSDLAALKLRVFGAQGLDKRLRRLQNRTRNSNQNFRNTRIRLQRVERKVQSMYDRLELDNCKSNPCDNGGICFNMFNGFICKCTTNFEGATCEKDVNECSLYAGTDLGCQNGGQCVNQFGGYSCICSPGFFGIHCTQRKGDCTQSSAWELCGHGTCVSSNDNFGYKCICDQGWKTNGLTPVCSMDVDECSESHPSCTTKCINLPGSFTCAPCEAGLTGNGVSCRDIDECATPQNGGCSLSPRVPCINSYGSYHCGECPLGWTGDGKNCIRSSSTNENGLSNGCASANICHPDATCTEISNTVVCTCRSPLVGSGMGLNGCVAATNLNCNSLPCLNGGTCIDSGSSYTCLCPMGFRAPNCVPIQSPCSPNPCHNNGRCRPRGGTSFQCQCQPGYNGRLCDNRFSRCGGMMVGTTGRIKYPEGSQYDHNAQCAWVIRTNETNVLNVTFNAFELEDSTECRFDWLQINDGRTAATQVIGRFCGSHKPMGGNIISTTNHLYFWFRSDNSTSKEGFDLEWNSIPPQCGGIIEVESHGTIATPGSPGNYPKNRDCLWQLRAPNNKRIKLTFFSLQIENHDSCNFDYVEITDPISNVVLEKFCNTSHPAPLMLPTNEALIHFHSDNDGGDTGFQILYSVEERIPGCGGTFTSKEGIISSPIAIQDPISCEYDIKMSASESITIEFTKFEMGEDDCIEVYDVNADNQIKALQSKYCGGYGESPVVFHSVYNAVQIKFYSKGGQFSLKYMADCSYTFESDNDTIISPSYPTLSNIERFCSYKIVTEPNTVIMLYIIDFDLEDSSLEDNNDCAYTFLKINDGLDQRITGPYCGNSTPPRDIVTKSNMVFLHFQSGQTSSGRGFKIEYKSIPMGRSDCGGVYTKPGYSIRLPTGDDGLYMHDMSCYWIIMAPINKGIVINWKSFKLERSSDCSYDYVEIYDNLANDENNRALGRYCDSFRPPSFTSHSRILTIKFVSDYSDASDGFEATYDFVDLSNQCGGEIYSSTGKLNSPEYPLNYTNDMNCTWVITTPPGTQIELQIEMFELEESVNCVSDWLEVKNGGSAQSTHVGNFCGKTIPRVIPSFTNQMRLHFHSDSFVSARGFQIKWYVFSNGCGGNVNSDFGAITSPSYPNPYPNNAECDWRIHVHDGSSIHFTIEDLGMEDLFQCNYDSLEIFDGRTATQGVLAKLCNLQDKPKQFDSSSNEALIRFRTDSSNNDRGFRLSYYSNCTRTIRDVHGVIESPNYRNPYYKNDVNCTWTVKAPRGNRIFLEFTHYESIDTSSQIYLREPTKNGTTNHTIVEKQSFNSTGDTLIISQSSSVINFRLEYVMVGCIQRFHRESGEFQSPNFPKAYPNDVECTWEIITELGQGIELTVENLDIEESVNCTNDALQISNHPTTNDPKERHCGKRDNLVITSSGHRLYVRFFSNALNNGKGFNATYRSLKSQCGGVLSSKNGVIQSPNYPLNYPPSVNCEWSIEVSPHHSITLTLEELDMEDFYDCEMDYIEAFFYDELGQTENTMFKKCGTLDSDSINQWTSTTNIVTLRFKSDDSSEAKGFKLSYKENCGERISVNENDFRYLEVRRNAQSNETCEWQLIAQDNTKHIIFTTTHVQLSPLMAMSYQTEGDCINIGAKIYDGEDDKAPIRSKFCKSHPPAIISNGHALTIKVPLNVISEFEGSLMIMDNYCGGQYESIMGKFSTPYYPSSYPVNIACEWNIVASEGNSIVLTIESFDLEDSDGCNDDYLEVREGHERGRLLGTFCGTNVPSPIQGVDSLWIKFKSDDDNVGEGFLATYNYALHNEINNRTNGTIESPKYPTKFDSTELYSWRISVDRDYAVLLTIKHIVDVDIPFIKFYDGYSDIGAQIDYTDTHIVRSNTNMLYFTATRGPFQFEWEQLSKEALRSNRSAEEKSKQCGQQLLTVDSPLLFNSPGYPLGYSANLQCSWMWAPLNPGTHSVLQFLNIDLEEFSGCFADYVKVSSSSDLENWKELDQLCKKTNTTTKLYHGTPYLKLDFVTDAGVNKSGFSTYVKTVCGSKLTEQRGFVNITSLASGPNIFQMNCVWTIQVRQGRRIRLTFPDSYLQNPTETSTCRTYFVARNGMAEDSPFLGKGKYCESNITDVLDSSSNRAYVKFVRVGFPRFRASFHYEEINHECSDEITLSDESMVDRIRTITSPNYPNIPNPHLECIWTITAPVHHDIAVDFVGNFDIAVGSAPISEACDREYVQLNDGATELMPMIGRYCGTTKPDSKTSTGNVLRIKYYTDISEPHVGFMANVSIGRCGGSYYTNEGIINPPQNLILRSNERDFECVYTIELEKGSTINLTLDTLQLPDATDCSAVTHLELQEIDTFGDVENVTDIVRVCGYDQKRYIVETNKVIIRYKIKGTSPMSNAFKISYSAIGARCGETILAYRGILQTPNYPEGVRRPTHCSWRLRAPKGKRIKIEFLDFDTGAVANASTSFGRIRSFRGRLTFANDFQMHSIIARVSENPPAQVISTDNTMAIDAFLLSFSRHRGFKLRYSSEEDSEACRNSFDLTSSPSGTVQFQRDNDTNVYCSYDVELDSSQTLALHIDKYETYLPTSDPMGVQICRFVTPFMIVRNGLPLLPELLCNNETQRSVRLPFTTNLVFSGNKRNKLHELNLSYQVYRCGGIQHIYPGDNMTITQPIMAHHIGKLECAWVITMPIGIDEVDAAKEGTQFEITLTADLKGKCEDQYLMLYNGPNQNSPHLGRFCGQMVPLTLVVEGGIFFEYITSSYETASTFTVSAKEGSGCGGRITYPYRMIIFDEQYKNNVECIWEIATEPGFHIGLSFIERFYIESSTDCKKDYIKVQQKNLSGEWIDLQKICGRDPPVAVNTTNTEMRLIFRSDGDTLGDGFTALFERNCGGIVTATNDIQQLSSPGYPDHYENYLTCNYTILPQDRGNAGILVRFVDFDLEAPPISKCMFDNVTVYTQNHLGSVEETVLCGSKKQHEFRGKERISVVLNTDRSYSSKGFLLEYSSNLCGGLITNSTVITSPHLHGQGDFPPSSNCFWNLTAPEGYKILIKFEELDFESISNCAYDSVEVYKGLVQVADQRLASFCGNLTGNLPVLSIPSNTGLIRSFSDENDASRGFRALVSFVPNCDRLIYLGPDNTTYEFNTYANSYANNLDCSYVFSTSSERQLLIDFNTFHVEETPSCNDDYLEIRDGAGPFADIIGQFCGHVMPSRLMSSRNSLFLRFVSDSEFTSSGFTAKIWSTPLTCGQHVMEIKDNEKIVLKSPEDGKGKYLKNLNCFWRIKANKNIHLKFDKLYIGGENANGTCGGDYLKIYKSEDANNIEKGYGSQMVFNGQFNGVDYANYATEHIYCGSHLPNDYFATTKELFIKFKTDEEEPRTGFSLTAMAVNGCFRNFTGTQGRILLAETSDHCDIYIKAPQNYSLSIYYTDVTFADYDCNVEYIEVFDAHTNTSLQKVCAYTETGKSLFTTTNELRMRIKMNNVYTQYDMTYLASLNSDGPGCGGNLYNTGGLITNPFYPNNVRNNSDCAWNIRVPNNVHVLLKFDVFDLGAKSTCHSDYLQIIEHNVDGTVQLARQFCGEDHPQMYKSSSNYVTVRFHKTVNYDGTGWVLRFSGVYANYKIPDYYLSS